MPPKFYSWFAVTLLAVLVSFAHEKAQASPVAANRPLAVQPSAVPAGFRFGLGRSHFGGGHFGNRHRSFPRRPRASRAFADRHWREGRGDNTRGHNRYPRPRHGREGTANSDRNVPPHSNGVDGSREPSRQTSGEGGRYVPPFNPPPPIELGVPVAAFTILGAGGTNRPPIAPRFTHAPGQRPADVASALLNKKRHRPRELVVEVAVKTPDGLRERLANEYVAQVRDIGVLELTGTRILHLKLAQGQDLRTALTRLLQDNRVITAQPNYIYTPVQGPSQSTRSEALSSNGAAPLPTGAGVKIAVIDTCVEPNHAELQGSVTASFDAIQPGSARCRPENHGTGVASLIAGHSKLQGTAAGASLLPARAFTFSAEDNEIDSTSREIALALNWTPKAGAQVANLSFAGPADPLVERLVAAAYRKGIVLVAAAGNAGPASEPLYPAAYPEVIAVTAANGSRGIYSAANRGKHICVSAPGVDVLVAHINNTYGTESGTSFAAAKVSGVVASLLEKRPKAGPDEIRTALQSTATGVPGVDKSMTGFGLVNAKAAVAFVETSIPK
jgi:subtilisin family serine protease